MGWLELMLEQYNPGPKGTIDAEVKGPSQRHGIVRFFLFMIAFVIIGAGLFGIFFFFRPVPVCGIIGAIIWITYFVLALFLRPKPNYDNMGWAGGLIDNPFRYSDDINRGLFFLNIYLYPGRILAFWMFDFIMFVLMKGRRKERAQDKWKRK